MASLSGLPSKGAREFNALLLAQALTVFNQNALRSALLALATFRGLAGLGWSVETIIGVSTILVTAPYALLSIAAGRLADLQEKAKVIGAIKAAEIPVYLLAAWGLLTLSLPALLLALLLTGVLSTLLGPAKFGILPDLVPASRLMRANAWMSATNTLAILLGLVFGSLMLDALHVLASLGVVLAVLGWGLSCRIRAATPAEGRVRSGTLWGDHLASVRRLLEQPALAAPILGCCWFWFQGALNTTLFPLLVAQLGAQASAALSFLFIVTTLGVAVGAVAARQLRPGAAQAGVVAILFAAIAVPMIDVAFASPPADATGLVRLGIDLFVISVGTGFYLVPVTMALQVLARPDRRARIIGLNHALNGVAMMLAGAAMLALGATGIPPIDVFVALGLLTAIAASWSTAITLKATANIPQAA